MKPVPLFDRRRGSPIPPALGPRFIAIDPGKKGTGWALFEPHLVACGLGAPPFDGVVKLAIELPNAYPTAAAPPNDLIELAFLAGRYAAYCRDSVTLWPREWKGTMDADVCTNRIRLRLTPKEAAIVAACEDVLRIRGNGGVSLMHNALDAVGLGKYVFLGLGV